MIFLIQLDQAILIITLAILFNLYNFTYWFSTNLFVADKKSSSWDVPVAHPWEEKQAYINCFIPEHTPPPKFFSITESLICSGLELALLFQR